MKRTYVHCKILTSFNSDPYGFVFTLTEINEQSGICCVAAVLLPISGLMSCVEKRNDDIVTMMSVYHLFNSHYISSLNLPTSFLLLLYFIYSSI